MKKENIKFIILMVVIVVVMFTVYMKVNTQRLQAGTCTNTMTSAITESKENRYELLINKQYKTKANQCVSLDMQLDLQVQEDKIVFYDSAAPEYQDKFDANPVTNKKSNTASLKDIELVSKYATLDKNKVTFVIKTDVKEKGKVNTYEITDEIYLKLKDGKLVEGK